MKKKEFKWYVEPQDAHTNEVVSREISDENFHRDLPDDVGIPHKVGVPMVADCDAAPQSRSAEFAIPRFCPRGSGQNEVGGIPWQTQTPMEGDQAVTRRVTAFL